MNLAINKLKSRLSNQAVEGLKATGLLFLGIIFVGTLFLLFSDGDVVKDTVVQETPAMDTMTQTIENTYELAPAEYVNPSDIELNDIYIADSTGEVLGANGGDCSPDFKYKKQDSCYQGNTAPTACEEVKGEDENGNTVTTAFCGNAYVEVRVKEHGVTYPRAFMSGSDPASATLSEFSWAKEQVIAPCYDKETNKIIPGTTCYNSLGSGGNPYSSPERDPAFKLASPILADELWKEEAKLAEEEPTVRARYFMQIASEDGDHGPFYIDTSQENSLVNSPIAALKISELGGIPQISPLNTSVAIFHGSECDGDPGASVEYLELPDLPGYIDTVNCQASVTGPAEQDIKMNIKDWYECKKAPDSAPCVYRLSEFMLITSMWGTQFQCQEGQCPIESYDYTLSSLTAPGAKELQVDGLENVGGAVYQTQYVTTPCLIEYRDHSKLAPKWKDVHIKCLWVVPHTRKLESQRMESAPGIYPDNDKWLRRALDEAAGGNYFHSKDPLLECGY